MSFPLFAQVPPSPYIFLQPITGASDTVDDRTLITRMITTNILARNCAILDSPYGTDFILSGSIAAYYGEQENFDFQTISPDITTVFSYNTLMTWNHFDQLYIFQLTLRDTKANKPVVIQNLIFVTMDDVYNFFPLMMYNIFSHIFPASVPASPGPSADYNDWRNKWLYLRASLNFPITFYKLKPDGLIGGSGVFTGPFDNPTGVAPLDNKVTALPGGTIGLEVQVLNWLSIEPKFQAAWEYMNDTDFLTITTGVEIKFPLKFMGNAMVEPYGALSIPLYSSEKIFDSSPPLGLGSGIQIAIKGGLKGAFLFDLNYMYFPGDAVTKNPYAALYPNPDQIHFQRSAIGIGIGYKAGTIDRKKK